MKKLIIILVIGLFGCKPEPEFYLNGKPYYTRTYCIKNHTETIWEYHYGYNYINTKFEFHFGPNTKTICDEYRIDTIEIR